MTKPTNAENFQALLLVAKNKASGMLDKQALKIQADPAGGIPKPLVLAEIEFPEDHGWGYTLTITKPGAATSQILAALLNLIDVKSMVAGTAPVMTEAGNLAITGIAKALSADGAQYTIVPTEDPTEGDDMYDEDEEDGGYYDDEYDKEITAPVTTKAHPQQEWKMATWNCSSCGGTHSATHMTCPDSSNKKTTLKEFVITVAATQKVKIMAPSKKEAERLAPTMIDPWAVTWMTQ